MSLFTAEEWQRAEPIIDDALDEPPERRSAFLDVACASAPELRARIEQVLDASERVEGALSAPVAAMVREMMRTEDAPAVDSWIDRRVGPYRLVREIGRGGMGAVYLGVRADEQFRKQVAVKFVRRGPADDELIKRFKYERQILASLDHPNIARLLDGGVYDDTPYVVMEYVEGEHIDRFCQERGLPFSERLTLFRQVCGAVQYLHKNLVVHRDLKPSNILVTPDGDVRLLDFGIAKLTDDALGDADAPLTQTGARVMTPEYASPEQVQGAPITTATDVYALGILLYELLVGRRPFNLKGKSPSEIERVVCTVEPLRPSTAVRRATNTTALPAPVGPKQRTDPERLRRRLAGDLDNIILKALRKDPEQRYVSVDALTEDLRLYQEGRPVLARQPSLVYRTSKFIRRHRISVVAMMLVMLSIATGLGAALWQAEEKGKQAAKAVQIKDFLLNMIQISDPDVSLGETIAARDLLDQGATRVESELAQDPAVQTEMMLVLAGMYEKLALYESARPLIERALAIRREVLGAGHASAAEALQTLGSLHSKQGDYGLADSLLLQALAVYGQQRPVDDLAVARTLTAIGEVNWRMGRLVEADSVHQSALLIRRALLGMEHPDVAETLSHLGVLARTRGDLEAAEDYHQEAFDIRRKHFGETHHLVSESLRNMALALHSQSRYAEAEEWYRRALTIQRRLYPNGHPETARTLNSLASLLSTQGGAFAEADSLFQEALSIHRAILGPRHSDVANTLTNLAILRENQGLESMELLEEALSIRLELHGPQSQAVALVRSNIGTALRNQGRYAEALPIFGEVLRIFEARLGPRHAWVALTFDNLAGTYFALRDYQSADSLYLRALAIQEESLPPTHVDLAVSNLGLGEVLLAQGRPGEAEPLLRSALVARTGALSPDHWRVAEAQSAYGACLSALGRVDEGAALLYESLRRMIELFGENHVRTRRAQEYVREHEARERVERGRRMGSGLDL